MKKISLYFVFFVLFTQAFAQDNLLQSGPMVGYSTMKEVMLWVQTKQAAKVHFIYFDKEKPTERFKTEIINTQTQTAFVAKTVASVLPGKKYVYELFINDKVVKFSYPLSFQSQVLWQFRTDPPDFTFAFGSCNYVNETEVDRPGKPYGAEHQIFKTIYDKKPDFMLWGGDNTYLREVDWDTRSGILHRYTHTRSLPEVQALLASTHHYALWDDHDYGPNDADRGYWMKETTLETFKLFWANPNYVMEKGVSGTFTWSDVQFFLLDNRFFRSPIDGKTGKKEMFGETQIQWLIDALKLSQSPFKLIVTGGQVLNSDTNPRLENYIRFAEEREYLLKKIKDEQIQGVIFLTGDRHHSEISKMDREGSYPLYDITISPFTAGPVGDRAKDEKNTFRIPDTYFGDRNFSLIQVSGPRKERVMSITLFNKEGQEIWKKEIKASELR